LTLFAEVSERQPLACIVDDAQWLDQSSAQIIGFVARRLLAERIALVVAARTGVGDNVLVGLPALRIEGLRESDARALLLENVHGPLDAAVRDQIVTESHGNPLALRELPRAWSGAGLAGGFAIPKDRSVAGKVEQSYARRLLQLPPETQLLVLTAAVEPLGDPVLLHRAAQELGLEMAALGPAVDAGLVRLRERVEFAHPLVRSAAYHTASAEDCRSAHRALAEATNPETDPDRRAWHRGRATTTPDEEVAADLERSASRAESRGGVAAASAFLTRATELTPDPAHRVRRALDAAYVNVTAGAFDTARSLLTVVSSGPLDERQRARVDLLRAQLELASSRGNAATPLLLAAAGRLESLDPQIARQTYLDAFGAAHFGARLNERVGVSQVALAAANGPRPSVEPTAADLLLDAYVALADDYAAAVPVCRNALQRLSTAELPPEERLRWAWYGIVIALELWDDESAYVLSRQYLELARRAGALSELGRALTSCSTIVVFSGEFESAATLVTELAAVQEATGMRTAPYPALQLLAWRGQGRQARALIEATIRDASARGEGIAVAIAEYASAVLSNGLAEYADATAAGRRASEHRELVLENWGLAELVESASRTGNIDLATDALDRLARKATATKTVWALGIAARSRALLAGDAAEGLFREALEQLSRSRIRTELARTHLLYGEWLRRMNRRLDARRELNVAYEMFVAIGMDAFAERARRELAGTGARVRKRKVEARVELTAQEAQVARLARDGLSNPEIGAKLFISARTVEWHVGKVFSKLGISSRKQLRDALADDRQRAGV
ncbi:MAG: LuxR C-terminal-related transcriptional regulator, partial [Actinomycetota bacterium]|nr:LuxR C-terminal-related transcriptional regulator [Actinomycetota bacterium]